MANPNIYQQPVVLQKHKHHQLHFSASKDMRFTSAMNAVPVNGVEFFTASRDFPILFSQDKNGQLFPIALLTLGDNGHQLLNEKGIWPRDTYLPAFFRRYPFIISAKGEVCFDNKAPHFSNSGGKPLFTESGDYSPTLKSAINFLAKFDKEHKNTLEFITALNAANLLKPCDLTVKMGKETVRNLNGLLTIDAAKFAKLPETHIVEWHKKGWLAWCYAQMHSMGALNILLTRHIASLKAST